MSKLRTNLNVTIRVTFLVLVALLLFSSFGGFVILVFVPVAGWYIWGQHDKIKELEARLAALEGPKKPEKG